MEADALRKLVEKLKTEHEAEIRRRTELATKEREEAVAAAFQQGKEQAAQEIKDAVEAEHQRTLDEVRKSQPDPSVLAHSREFVAALEKKKAPAIARVTGLFNAAKPPEGNVR